MFAIVALVSLVGGALIVFLGSWSGWINIGLSIVFAVQSIGYFRLYRRMSDGENPSQDR
jgi:uncharacterized membrane protein